MKVILMLLFSCFTIVCIAQNRIVIVSLHAFSKSSNLVKLRLENNEVRVDTTTSWNQPFSMENSYTIKTSRSIRKMGKYSSRKYEKIQEKLKATVCFADMFSVEIYKGNEVEKYGLINATSCCPFGLRRIILGLDELVNTI